MKASDDPLLRKSTCFRLIILFGAFIFESCAHVYYLPGNPNVPLFTEKYEFHGSLSTGGGAITSGTDVQAALSLTNHIAVMTNFMSSKYSSNNSNNGNMSKGTYFEGAAGYFKPFYEYGVFEIYGGVGTGSQHHEYDAWPGNIYRGQADLSFAKAFIQPSLGVTFNAFDIALSSGFSRLNFKRMDNSVDPNSMYYDDLDMIASNRISFLFEPAITVRGGWKFVKIQLQYLLSLNLTNNYLNFEPGKLSVGIYISLSKKYMNEISKK